MYRHFFDDVVGASFDFLSPTTIAIFLGEPHQQGIKYTGVGKFCNYHALSWKQYEVGP